MSSEKAIWITGIIVLISIIVMVVLLEKPLFYLRKKNTSENKPKIAALAIRDNVSPFQKMGSRLFTFDLLEKHYDQTYYFTQTNINNQQEAMQEALEEALNNYDQIDIFLLAHSNYFYFWIAQMDRKLVKKIRLVYNTGCKDAYQANLWLSLGAEAYVAHEGELSLSPVFYVYFLRRWVAGWTLKEAVAEANDITVAKIKPAEKILNIRAVNYYPFAEKAKAVITGDETIHIR